MKKFKLQLKLFLNSLFLSAFTFGGGYVIISMIRKKYVEKYKMLTDEEMLDITTIAQSTPGPIAINASLMVGYKIAGVIGAFMCVLGTIIPPVVIISIVYGIYNLISDNALVMAILNGMNAGISAIICDVILSMINVVRKEKNYIAIITLPVVFCLSFFLNVNVYFLMLPCIVLGLVVTYYEKFKLKHECKNFKGVCIELNNMFKTKKSQKGLADDKKKQNNSVDNSANLSCENAENCLENSAENCDLNEINTCESSLENFADCDNTQNLNGEQIVENDCDIKGDSANGIS